MTEALRLAVVGDPVGHSLSPAIHTAALEAMSIEGSYRAIAVDGPGMTGIVAQLRTGELDGVNVTMPHKRVAAELVDHLTPEASQARSVNTIVRQSDGRLVGHSTDISGLRRLWHDRGLPSDGPVLILGAGGAAAAAALAAIGTSFYGSARRADAITEMAALVGIDIQTVAWGTAVVDAVVINTTPLGMRGERLPDRIVGLAGALVDLPYGTAPTPASVEAGDRAIPYLDGIDVLVAQAADSFHLWTASEAPVDVMMTIARKSSSTT